MKTEKVKRMTEMSDLGAFHSNSAISDKERLLDQSQDPTNAAKKATLASPEIVNVGLSFGALVLLGWTLIDACTGYSRFAGYQTVASAALSYQSMALHRSKNSASSQQQTLLKFMTLCSLILSTKAMTLGSPIQATLATISIIITLLTSHKLQILTENSTLNGLATSASLSSTLFLAFYIWAFPMTLEGALKTFSFQMPSFALFIAASVLTLAFFLMTVKSINNRVVKSLILISALSVIIFSRITISSQELAFKASISSAANLPRAIESIHQDYFLHSSCYHKYHADQAAGVQGWETSDGMVKVVSQECSGVSQEFYLNKFSTIVTLIDASLISLVVLLGMSLLSRKSSTFGKPALLFVISIISISVYLFFRLLKDASYVNPAYAPFAGILSDQPNQIFQNSVEYFQKSYTVRGSFELKSCQEAPIFITSSFGHSLQDTIKVGDDCKFSLTQHHQSTRIAYTQHGFTNVVDIKDELINFSENTLDIGILPLLNIKNKFITKTIEVVDLISLLPVEKIRINLTPNHAGNDAVVYDHKSNPTELKLSNGYYTLTIQADGYRPYTLKDSELLENGKQTVYLMKSDAANNLIHLKNTFSDSIGLRVKMMDRLGFAVCSIDRINPVCPGGYLLRRTDSNSNIVQEFVVVMTHPKLHSVPSIYQSENHRAHNNGRLLQEQNPPADNNGQDQQPAPPSTDAQPETPANSQANPPAASTDANPAVTVDSAASAPKPTPAVQKPQPVTFIHEQSNAVIEISGYESEATEPETGSRKSSSRNWRTATERSDPWDRTVNVNTVMSNYLIFSPNITCLKPTVLDNQEVSVVKVKGYADTFWYVLTYNQTEFVVITDGKNHPAEIRLPNGVSTLILSEEAREVPQHETVFATVVDIKGKYFNIDDNLWEKINNVQETPYTGKLPEVEFLSSNAINLDSDVNGKFLKRQVITLVKSIDTTNLLKLSSDPNKEVVDGRMYSSYDGYRLMKAASHSDKGKQDIYRVCVYCLKFEVERLQFQTTINDKIYNQDSIIPEDFFNINGLFSQFLLFAIHTVPHNTFVDHQVVVSTTVFVMTEIGEFKSLGKKELRVIVDHQEAGDLNHIWATKEEATRLLDEQPQVPLLVLKDSLYSLNIAVVSDFMLEDAAYYEPKMENLITSSSTGKRYGLDELYIDEGTNNKIFLEGRAVPGLYLKSTHPDAIQAWPYVLANEDEVINKYFINVAMIKSAYALANTNLDDYKKEPYANSEAQDILDRWKPIITRATQEDPLANKHVVYLDNKEIELSDSCMESFFSMNVLGSFKEVEKALYRLRTNKFFYKHGGKIYIYNFEPMREKLLNNDYTDPAANITIHECLQLDVVSNDPNLLRRIWVDDFQLFEGFCHGDFVNNTKCTGSFRGSYKKACTKDIHNTVTCKTLVKDFICDGATDKTGCNDTYTQTIFLNKTKHQLVTSHPYNVVDPFIDSSTKITLESQTANTTIECMRSYNDSNKACQDASGSKTVSLVTNKKFTIKCEGILNAETLECYSSNFDLESCEQESVVENFNQCSGNYVKRHCGNGGNFYKCLGSNPSNHEDICTGGFWNGEFCKVRPFHIIVDDHTYIGGTCDGTYLENKSCIGTLAGKIIECPDTVLTPDNLCTSDPVDSFVCEGKTTQEGCTGIYRSKTPVQDTTFALSIFQNPQPIYRQKNANAAVTTLLSLAPADGNQNAKDITINCSISYDDENKLCRHAVYQTVSNDGESVTRELITCDGVLNLVDLTCDTDQYRKEVCHTRYPNAKAPLCNGTFDLVECGLGGKGDSCPLNNKKNVKIHCDGYWNGKTCFERPLHIIINNAAYVTGECIGEYHENDYCQGTMNGKVVLCKPGLNTENLCEGPVVDEFTCVGKLTRDGCHGKYNGGALLRNAKMSIETEENAYITLSKVQDEGYSILKFKSNDPDYLEFEPDAEYTWQDVHADCHANFSNPASTCGRADLGGVMNFAVNKTYIDVHCEGTLQMYPLSCDSEAFTVKYCNTTADPYDSAVCNGTYTELSCTNGGNLTDCFGEDNTVKNIYCNGTYNRESAVCDGFVPPTFSIIKVNESHWLKGVCSNHILNNACEGDFSSGEFVKCTGDPLNNEGDFKACISIEGDVFGTCNGITNSTGCYGKYSHPVEIENYEVIATNGEGDHHYDFIEFNSPVSLSADNDDISADIFCGKNFNPKVKTCLHGKATVHVKKPKDEKPGVSIRRTAECEKGVLDLKKYSCQQKFVYSACFGKSVIKTGIHPTCLGDYISIVCPHGGDSDGCLNESEDNRELYCLKSFFDGKECIALKLSQNSDIVIHKKEPTTLQDEFGRTVKIAEFEIDKFTMINAQVESSQITKSVIKNIDLYTANLGPSGAIEDIRIKSNVRSPISLDEGHLETMIFRKFMLDELDYSKFADDDSCKLVHITFTELEIDNTLFENFNTDHSVIRKITWGEKEIDNFGTKNLKIDLGFGKVILRNVDVYLPYITKAVIQQWIESPNTRRSVNVIVPKIENLVVPPYKIHFDTNRADIYLEFPTFTISDRSIDLIFMSDYILESNSIEAEENIVDEVLANYQEDERIEKFEKEEIDRENQLASLLTYEKTQSLTLESSKSQPKEASNPTQETGEGQVENSGQESSASSTSSQNALVEEGQAESEPTPLVDGSEPSSEEVN
jgi:hypothetical protein